LNWNTNNIRGGEQKISKLGRHYKLIGGEKQNKNKEREENLKRDEKEW